MGLAIVITVAFWGSLTCIQIDRVIDRLDKIIAAQSRR